MYIFFVKIAPLTTYCYAGNIQQDTTIFKKVGPVFNIFYEQANLSFGVTKGCIQDLVWKGGTQSGRGPMEISIHMQN